MSNVCDTAYTRKNGRPEAAQQPPVKVLLVDDDAASLQALGDALRRHGGGVVTDTVDSVPAALGRMAVTDYDVVVSDIRMPEMDGLALLARTRKLRAHTPTLLVTWHDERDLAVQALRGGAYDFIRKPIDADHFLAALGRALQMRQLDRQVDDQKRALDRHARALEQTLKELRRQTALVQLLRDIAVAANQAVTLEGVLRTCLERVCTHTGWPVGHVYLPAGDGTGQWAPAPYWYPDTPERFAAFRRVTGATRFAPGAGLPGRVAASGKPAWVSDVAEDPGFRRARPAEDLGVRAAFAFPVMGAAGVAAVLEFLATEAVEPDAPFLEVMDHIGTQVGQVIERLRVQKALEESEARFRCVAQSASDAIVSADGHGNITFWNQRARVIFGYTEEEVLGRPLTALMPEPYREAHQRGLERLHGGGGPKLLGKTLELQGLRKTGEVFPLELSLACGETAQGTFYTGIIRDISERKRAEAARQYLAAIVESSDDAIIGKTLQGVVTSWNKAAERLYGYTRDEMVGQPISFLVPPDRSDEVPMLLQRIRQGRRISRHETVRQRKDGTLVNVSLTISPVSDPSGNLIGASMIARDITEQKRAEQRIRRLNDELRQKVAEVEAANKELDAFSYTVSHDLRAPLRAIDGFTRILLEDHAPQLPEEARHYLDRVRDAARQMGRLIDDLLAFSRLSRQPLLKQPVAPADLVRLVLEGLHPECEGRQVRIDLGDLPPCRADPALLKQVFVNLLANALKYTRWREEAVIAIGYRDDPGSGEGVYFVKDNGVGFDMRYADKLFGVFQRLHRAEDYEGTGVGLATVQRIIHRHGGRVWAEAEADRGAAFYFTLEEGRTHD